MVLQHKKLSFAKKNIGFPFSEKVFVLCFSENKNFVSLKIRLEAEKKSSSSFVEL